MKKKLLIGTGIAAVLLVPGLLPGMMLGAIGGIACVVWAEMESGESIGVKLHKKENEEEEDK